MDPEDDEKTRLCKPNLRFSGISLRLILGHRARTNRSIRIDIRPSCFCTYMCVKVGRAQEKLVNHDLRGSRESFARESSLFSPAILQNEDSFMDPVAIARLLFGPLVFPFTLTRSVFRKGGELASQANRDLSRSIDRSRATRGKDKREERILPSR